MNRFKSWSEAEKKLGKLTQAETELKKAIKSGTARVSEKFTGYEDEQILRCLPEAPNDWQNLDTDLHIRADVLRMVLCLDVDEEGMTELGTSIYGALISGTLNLEYCDIKTLTFLRACRFEHPIAATGAKFHRDLSLQASALPNINLAGAEIEGQFSLKYCAFETTEKEKSLSLHGAKISDALIFKSIQHVGGAVDLTSAYAENLVDDAQSWGLVSVLTLDGFRYERIGGAGFSVLQERLDWLEKGSHSNSQFFPQPYTHLATVYQNTGHERQARDVRVALARCLARRHAIDQKSRNSEQWGWLLDTMSGLPFLARLFSFPLLWLVLILPKSIGRLWHVSVDKGFDWVVGYGFKPGKTLLWILGLIAVVMAISFATWRAGDFAPNSAPILVSDGWATAAGGTQFEQCESPETIENTAAYWSDCTAAGQDWETFNSFAYAADIVIPIVEIGQTSAWAPSTKNGVLSWGWLLWWMRWVFTALGWVVTALGAAAITGVIRRE